MIFLSLKLCPHYVGDLIFGNKYRLFLNILVQFFALFNFFLNFAAVFMII
jgi:hypothetical protein